MHDNSDSMCAGLRSTCDFYMRTAESALGMQVWWAQKQLEHFGNNLPGNAGVEPTVPMSYELPTGPYTDPSPWVGSLRTGEADAQSSCAWIRNVRLPIIQSQAQKPKFFCT